MPSFVDPPLLSRNTIVATVVRSARALGLALPAIKKIFRHLDSEKTKAKVFAGYEPGEHDVFVATYPKSGTNWMMQMVTQIAWRGAAEFDYIHQLVAWPESDFYGIVPLRDPGPWEGSATGQRGIKTAMAADFVPYHPDAAYVSVIRDPKDVFVSNYRFLFTVFDLFDDITMEEWFELFLTPEIPGGSWADHTASFWAWRDRPNVCVLCFGDIKQDLPGTVDRVAEMMHVSLTSSERARVVERCSFSYMKEHEPQFAPPKFRFTSGRAQMVRKGAVGGSGELLSDEQQARIDEHFQGELRRLGSDFPYAEKFDVVTLDPPSDDPR